MLYAAILYAALAHEDWGVREAASARLTQLVDGWPGSYGPSVEAWARGASNPEVANRSARLVRLYRNHLALRYRPSGIPVWPLADAYPVPGSFGLDARNRQLGMGHYRPLPSDRGPPFWDAYRRATECFARGLIRDGESEEAVNSLLRRWYACERACLSDSGWEHQPVIESWTAWTGYPPVESP